MYSYVHLRRAPNCEANSDYSDNGNGERRAKKKQRNVLKSTERGAKQDGARNTESLEIRESHTVASKQQSRTFAGNKLGIDVRSFEEKKSEGNK